MTKPTQMREADKHENITDKTTGGKNTGMTWNMKCSQEAKDIKNQ